MARNRDSWRLWRARVTPVLQQSEIVCPCSVALRTVARLVPEWRVAAAVSLGNLAKVRLPETIRDVVVCADNDGPDSPAAAGLKKAIDHLLSTGARVRVARPDAGVKDWNDQLRAEIGE